MTAYRLLADIGGTNARFALQSAGSGCADIDVLPCRDYDDVGAAMDAYLARAEARGLAADGIRHAAIAIANPVEEDRVSMTNHHWSFSIEELRRQQGLGTLLVVNDFAALAMSLPHLEGSGRQRIGARSLRRHPPLPRLRQRQRRDHPAPDRRRSGPECAGCRWRNGVDDRGAHGECGGATPPHRARRARRCTRT